MSSKCLSILQHVGLVAKCGSSLCRPVVDNFAWRIRQVRSGKRTSNELNALKRITNSFFFLYVKWGGLIR